MINKSLFSSNSDEWATPKWLFDWLNKRFIFTLDPAATKENALCPCFCTKEEDGLRWVWAGHRVFLNPPYSRIKAWMKKCVEESPNCPVIVALVPARTDTRWFQDYAMTADHIHYIRGRLKFSNAGSAPFPSALLCWFGFRGL